MPASWVLYCMPLSAFVPHIFFILWKYLITHKKIFLLAFRISTFYGLIWWWRTNIISPSSGRIRASPAKRSLLLHLRSIDKRLFSLRLFCFSRSGCRSALGCTSKRSWCLVLLSCRTSLMNGMPRSLWSVEFDTYHGACAIDRSILDWQLCRNSY